MHSPSSAPRRGLTLVELLAVIAIVGVLVALLLPAVQYCREVARQNSCRSHLRQIALAMHAHEAAHGHLPTGGWGWRWHGDPDRGFGPRQPGGWIYGVLPFIEQQALREMGAGLPEPQKSQALSQGASVPVAIFHCPSRRSPGTFPFVSTVDFANMARPAAVARSDYAASAGDAGTGQGRGPVSLAEGDSRGFEWTDTDLSGVVFCRSTVTFAMIRDGLSNTYLVGEKHLAAREYHSGTPQNDDQHLLVGCDRDTLRATDDPPRPDVRPASDHSFGSAHPAGFCIALADGSVHWVSHEVDRELHRERGNRHDQGTPPAGP
ncbi:MAG: DUF1559 domain-containing protein [Pirellulaceae bacterium]